VLVAVMVEPDKSRAVSENVPEELPVAESVMNTAARPLYCTRMCKQGDASFMKTQAVRAGVRETVPRQGSGRKTSWSTAAHKTIDNQMTPYTTSLKILMVSGHTSAGFKSSKLSHNTKVPVGMLLALCSGTAQVLFGNDPSYTSQ
jgi:hypothetical protein